MLSVDFTDYSTHSVTSILHFDDDTQDDVDLLSIYSIEGYVWLDICSFCS